MLNSIGIRNLRSFVNETMVDIKPITVFVGKNSSGKSSLLRTFPLLRQSIEGNTTGPILWFGRFVDYGDFNQVLSNNTKDENPTIDFKFNLTLDTSRNLFSKTKDECTDVEITLKVSANKIKTIFHSVIIKIYDTTLEINSENNGGTFIVYHDNISLKIGNIQLSKNYEFIPRVLGQRKKDESSSINTTTKARAYFDDEYDIYVQSELEQAFLSTASRQAKKHFSNRSEINNIMNRLGRIGVMSFDDFSNTLKSAFRDQKSFMKHFHEDPEGITNELYPYLFGWNLNNLIRNINSQINRTFTSIKYIAPLRATTERYYRFQDLQVDEIDHTGSNLAMLLNSLGSTEQKNFAAWTKDNFGFSVFVKEVGAHYAVKIITNDDEEEYNISDMGFGYSQMLPIIASIWLETERRSPASFRSKAPIFVIEQPELHLHPAYQAKLGELFSKVISKAQERNLNIKIVFETHSPSIIEALGESIEDGILKPEDTSIYIFHKNDKGETKVDKSKFNANGRLTNWPVGFFSGR